MTDTMEQTIQVGFTKINGITVEVLQDSKNIRYRWVGGEITEKHKQESQCFLILDFSWSMQNSKSAKPLLETTNQVCQKLFTNGYDEVNLLFFGANTLVLTITKENINKINEIMDLYFIQYEKDKEEIFKAFNPCGTNPEIAIKQAIEMINKIKSNTIIDVIFITDGEFTNNKFNYKKDWNGIINKLNKSIKFNAIGYQNDKLENIKDLKKAFDNVKYENLDDFFADDEKSHIKLIFNYKTIKTAEEISIAFNQVIDDMISSNNINKIIIGGQIIYEYDVLYKPIREALIKEFDINKEYLLEYTASKMVTRELLEKIISFELEIAGVNKQLTDQINEVSQLSSLVIKKRYQDIIKDKSPYISSLQQKYMELQLQIKTIKNYKDIIYWKSLLEMIREIMSNFRQIQQLVSEELNEKMSFELSTKISSSVDQRHLRTLQRRRINNASNRQETNSIISIKSRDPLILECIVGEKKGNIEMFQDIETLNDEFKCFYTQDNWEEMLNTLLCIPIEYDWKSGDDWCSGRATIKKVSMSGYLSLDGFKEMQEIFGGQNPLHTDIFKRTYINNAHDMTNAIIPIASDPYFLSKINLVKDCIGFMVAGSSLAFANRHINIYIPVIKQCLDSLTKEDNEKTDNILRLLLNTYRLLITKMSIIYDISQKPLAKDQIIYEVSIGNTKTSYFSTPYETAIICMSIHPDAYYKALETYNKKNPKLTIEQYYQLVWKMIYRHFVMTYCDISLWLNTEIWELSQKDILREQLKKVIKEIKTKEDIETVLNKNVMSIDKIKDIGIPKQILDDINKFKESQHFKTLMKLIEYVEEFMEYDRWNNFSKILINVSYMENGLLKELFYNDDELNEITFWSGIEKMVVKDKDCSKQSKESLIIRIVDIVNQTYGKQNKEIVDDMLDYINYSKRVYETRYYPVFFNKSDETMLNKTFEDIYNGKLRMEELRIIINDIIGEYFMKQICETLEKDDNDVIGNLYKYCRMKKHIIKIKENGLPHSCPAEPTSKFFLQELNNIEFSKYYKEVGFGWRNKKYKVWFNDLHNVMKNALELCDNNEQYNKMIDEYIYNQKSDISIEGIDKRVINRDYITHYYKKFNKSMK